MVPPTILRKATGRLLYVNGLLWWMWLWKHFTTRHIFPLKPYPTAAYFPCALGMLLLTKNITMIRIIMVMSDECLYHEMQFKRKENENVRQIYHTSVAPTHAKYPGWCYSVSAIFRVTKLINIWWCLGSWCNHIDMVCSYQFRLSSDFHYTFNEIWLKSGN